MRTLPEAIESKGSFRGLGHHVRVFIYNSVDGWVDFSNLEGKNWIISVGRDFHVDKLINTATVKLARQVNHKILTPSAFSSFGKLDGKLDIGAKIYVEAASVPRYSLPVATDWAEIFRGEIDTIDWSKDPISLECTDQAGILQRTFVETERFYGSNDPMSTDNDIEFVIQDILDNQLPNLESTTLTWNGTTSVGDGGTSFTVGTYIGYDDSSISPVEGFPMFKILSQGGGFYTIENISSRRTIPTGSTAGDSKYRLAEDRVTLHFEDGTLSDPLNGSTLSPGWAFKGYHLQRINILDAISRLVSQIGWSVRYKWLTGTGLNNYQFTMFEPDRTKATSDLSIDSSQWNNNGFQTLKVSRRNIRNVIYVTYVDDTDTKQTIVVDDAMSIDQYGRQAMFLTEGSSSQIDNSTEAQAMADGCLSDLKDPQAIASLTLPFFFASELGDVYTLDSKNILWEDTQNFALIGSKDFISAKQASTTWQLRGTVPTAGTKLWLKKEGRPGVSPVVDGYSDGALSIASSETGIGYIEIETIDPRLIRPQIKDWAYTEVYVHTSDPGDPPSDAYLKMKGRQTRFVIGGLTPGTEYNIRLVAVDEQNNKSTTSSNTVITTQLVGTYHSNNEDLHRPVLIPNSNFGHATLDINTTPPDSWQVTLGTWGASDEIFHSSNSQSGSRAIIYNQGISGTAEITSERVPLEQNKLYELSTVSYSDSGSGSGANDRVQLNLRGFEPDKTTTTGLWAAFNAIVVPGTSYTRGANYFYGESLGDGVTPGDLSAAFFEMEYRVSQDVGSTNYDRYVDGITVREARQAFFAYPLNAISVPANTPTKVPLENAPLNIGLVEYPGSPNPIRYGVDVRVAPTVNELYRIYQDGSYKFEGAVTLDNLTNDYWMQAYLYVNGVLNQRGSRVTNGGTSADDCTSVVTATIDLSKDDYVELYVEHNDTVGTPLNVILGTTFTFLSGGRVE